MDLLSPYIFSLIQCRVWECFTEVTPVENIPEKDPMEKMHELVAGKDVHFDLRPVSLQETIDALKSLKARKSSGGLSISNAIAKGAA